MVFVTLVFGPWGLAAKPCAIATLIIGLRSRCGLLGRTAKYKNMRFGQGRFNENVQCAYTVAGHGAVLPIPVRGQRFRNEDC